MPYRADDKRDRISSKWATEAAIDSLGPHFGLARVRRVNRATPVPPAGRSCRCGLAARLARLIRRAVRWGGAREGPRRVRWCPAIAPVLVQ